MIAQWSESPQKIRYDQERDWPGASPAAKRSSEGRNGEIAASVSPRTGGESWESCQASSCVASS